MLVCEPFNLAIDEIGRLTPWQIRRIYFHSRDKDGGIAVVSDADKTPPSEEELCKSSWRARGMSETRIKQLWRDRVEMMKRKLQERGDDGGQF